MLLNDAGFTSADITLTYDIQPPEYNAIRADLDSFKKDPYGREAWNGYAVADKTRGQGTVTIVAGTPFDVENLYEEQPVLNRGTDMEVRGEKKNLSIARIEIKDDNNTPGQLGATWGRCVLNGLMRERTRVER